jgi:tripartite-type tricarboxylate transporter receptor subunit TctC
MVAKASALAKTALASEALKTAFLAQGATPIWLSPADTAAFRRADEKKLAPVIIASGAKVN